MWSWFTAYIFDIGLLHVCYGQLTPVKTRYLLPVSHEYIAGSGLEFIKVTLFFTFTADQELVFDWIVGSCGVYLL